MSTDLEVLRQRVLASRANPQPLPQSDRQLAQRHASARAKGWSLSDLVVTSTGDIRTVQQTGRQTYGVSRVTTEVFASVDEAALAAEYLPQGYDRVEVEGINGWAYDVNTPLGYDFTFFIYWDRFQRVYRVRLIAPALERMGLVHATHLYSDGHLCMSSNSNGERFFNNAYAKSVMWAHGISQMFEGHAWPWGEAV